MKMAVCFAGVLLLANAVGAGQYFYWVDFSNPPRMVNCPPATGLEPWTPSLIPFGSPTVVDSFGHLTNQPLRFRGIGYEQIQFNSGKGAPNYFIEFDFETRNLNPSMFAFVILFDTPHVQNFYLHGLGYIGVPPANSPYLPGWTDNEPHHMRIDVDLIHGTWTLGFDDRPAATGPFSATSGDVLSIRMNLSAWRMSTPDDPTVQVAIDNVRIGTTAPAPPPKIRCQDPLFLDCAGAVGAGIRAEVEDSSTSPLTVVWAVDGILCQTNMFLPGTALGYRDVELVWDFGLGEHTVIATAANREAAPVSCATTVTVADTRPPEIFSICAAPDVLWPPNGRMVPVRIEVDAKDACGPTYSRIVGIESNELLGPPGHPAAGEDWQITGDLTVNLRAERFGRGTGRVYTIIVECVDAVGNRAIGTASVSVPHDQREKPNGQPAAEKPKRTCTLNSSD